jgi:RimJ/RimL family protein N-acetyltransferase
VIAPLHIDPAQDRQFTQAIGDFVSNGIFGCPGRIENYRAMAVVDGEKIIAGVLYNNWHPDTGVIEMHAASIDKRWLTRPVLKAMFALPFDQLGCQMCVLRVSERNKPMIRIAQVYGFDAYRIPRLRGRDEAELILTLTDDDWRASRFHKEAA